MKIIRSLSNNKASQETDLPVRVVKENAEYFAEIICSQFIESINSSKFHLPFKLANILPVFKNESRNHKHNYRPVSILPLISKVFGKIMNKQLFIYFQEILSKFQCGFCKDFSTQHCLLLMLEKWKRAVDNNKVFAALLTDSSKAFDCISHDLLIAKLIAYGLSLSALKLVHSLSRQIIELAISCFHYIFPSYHPLYNLVSYIFIQKCLFQKNPSRKFPILL